MFGLGTPPAMVEGVRIGPAPSDAVVVGVADLGAGSRGIRIRVKPAVNRGEDPGIEKVPGGWPADAGPVASASFGATGDRAGNRSRKRGFGPRAKPR